MILLHAWHGGELYLDDDGTYMFNHLGTHEPFELGPYQSYHDFLEEEALMHDHIAF